MISELVSMVTSLSLMSQSRAGVEPVVLAIAVLIGISRVVPIVVISIRSRSSSESTFNMS